MSSHDKLRRPASDPSEPPADQAAPRQIKAYDKYGREILIPEDQWRQKVLPGRLQQVWSDPQALYQTIAVAVQDGFHADILEASRHLISLAPTNEGIVCLHGIVLMRNELIPEAEAHYWDYLADHPQSAYVRANLARVVAAKGDAAGAEALLWQALQIDPNQPDGLLWWGAIYKERAGDEGFLDAMQKAAELPGSWRPELWLARNALEAKDLESALGFYRVVLERAPDNPDALMMISGDLGNNGYIDQIVRVLAPIYMPQKHGPFAGLNLLQAYLATKDLAGARRLLHELFELNRPDLQAHLARFSEECDKLKDELEPLKQEEATPSIEWAVLATPVWYPNLDDPVWLLPKKRPDAERILFVALSNTTRANVSQAPRQKPDDIGRLTRSIPLYLAEAFLFQTSSITSMAIALADGHYPVVSGFDLPKEFALKLASFDSTKADYVVTGSISEEAGEYTITFQVWNVTAEEMTATFSQTGGKSKVGKIVEMLQGDLMQFFRQPSHQTAETLQFYKAPGASSLSEYLLATEQSLALLLVSRGGSSIDLWGERPLLAVPLDLSLRMLGAPIPKLMFLAGLIRNKAYGSEIYQEFKPQVHALLEDATPDGPLARLTPLIHRLFGDPEEFLLSKDRLRKSAKGDYAAWLDKLQFSPPS